jgi:hypothetical protein
VAAQQAQIDHAEAAVAAEDAGAAAAPAVDPQQQLLLQQQAAAEAAVEAARGDPAAYAAALRAALEQSKALAAEGRQDAPAGWEWVACDECDNWRLVPGGWYRQKGLAAEGAAFKCTDNTERPGASCAEPSDWPEEEGGGGGGDGGGGGAGGGGGGVGGGEDGGYADEDDAVWEEV